MKGWEKAGNWIHPPGGGVPLAASPPPTSIFIPPLHGILLFDLVVGPRGVGIVGRQVRGYKLSGGVSNGSGNINSDPARFLDP